MVDWSKVKYVKEKDIPKGATQIHLYEFSNVLRPRGHMEKESIGQNILERLENAHKDWTNPKYGDNPDNITLYNTLRKNLLEEMEGAWRQFNYNIEENVNLKKMLKRIQRMAQRTWEEIGGDVLMILADVEQLTSMTSDEVVEAVVDANYMLTHGGDIDAYEYWTRLPIDKQTAIIKSAFPLEKYGM